LLLRHALTANSEAKCNNLDLSSEKPGTPETDKMPRPSAPAAYKIIR